MRYGRSIAMLTIAVVSAAFFAGCTGSSTAPEELIGVWTTDAEGYTGESIEFSRDRLIVSSDTSVFENSIEKVKTDKSGLPDTTLYTVYYLDRDGEMNLMNLFYSSEGGGLLRFKSEQDIAWKKD
jgi:hypothetical protein